VTETSRIKQMLFGGFTRCLYPLQKFDSDTERRFAIILERDAIEVVQAREGAVPDLLQARHRAAGVHPRLRGRDGRGFIFMVETKARTDINTQEVQAKAAAASALVQARFRSRVGTSAPIPGSTC
jgi:type III restriction enzyme